jgi:hypothetical protein
MTFEEAMALEIMPGVTMGAASPEQLKAHKSLLERTAASLRAMSDAEFERELEMWTAWGEKLDKHEEAFRVIKVELERRGLT